MRCLKDKCASSAYAFDFIAEVRKDPAGFSVFFHHFPCIFNLFRLSVTRKQISLWLLQGQGTMALQYYRIEP